MRRICVLAVLASAFAGGTAHAGTAGTAEPVRLYHDEDARAQPVTFYRSATGEFVVFVRLERVQPEPARLVMWRLGADGTVAVGPVQIPAPEGYDVSGLSARVPLAYNPVTDELTVMFLRYDVPAPTLVQRFSASGEPLAPPVEIQPPGTPYVAPLVPDPSTGGYVMQWNASGRYGGVRMVHLDSELRRDSAKFDPLRGGRAPAHFYGARFAYDARRERFLAVWPAGRRAYARPFGPHGRRLGKLRRLGRIGHADGYGDVEYSRAADAFFVLRSRNTRDEGYVTSMRRLSPAGRRRGEPTIVDVESSPYGSVGAYFVPANRAREMAVAWGAHNPDTVNFVGSDYLQRFDAANGRTVGSLFETRGSAASYSYGAQPNAYAVAWAIDDYPETDVMFDVLPRSGG
jgi:hypothetical protein